MNISLENWLRNKLQENEEMQDYAVSTETIRFWIDEYKQLIQPDVISSVLECNVCYKPFGDWLSLSEHYNEEHSKQTDL